MEVRPRGGCSPRFQQTVGAHCWDGGLLCGAALLAAAGPIEVNVQMVFWRSKRARILIRHRSGGGQIGIIRVDRYVLLSFTVLSKR